MKKVLILSLATVIMFFVLAACGREGENRGLSGTFERRDVIVRMEYTFSGNSYTATEYYTPSMIILVGYIQDFERRGLTEEEIAEAIESLIEDSINRFRDFDESDEYELVDERKNEDGIITSRTYRRTTTGTYSLTDDKIEMITDGRIAVYSFSRTENTITIDGEMFTRKN
jgi:hypothetical protein